MKDDAGRRWLYRELPGLVTEGVLSAEAAENLRRRYGPPESVAGPSGIALLIFGCLGSVLIGAGIILVLAHNWDDLSRSARAGLSLTLLVAAQGLAMFALVRRNASDAYREATAAFAMIALGACISLISQTYQIPGRFSDFLLVWMVLSLPLMYLFDARLPACLYWAGIALWVENENPLRPFFWLLASAGAPYVWLVSRRARWDWRTPLLQWSAILALLIGAGLAVPRLSAGLEIVVFAALLGAIYVLGSEGVEPERGALGRPFLVAGTIGIGVYSIVLSFEDVWPLSFEWSFDHTADARSMASPAVAALCGAFAMTGVFRLARAGRWHQALFPGVIVPAVAGLLLSTGGVGKLYAALLLNAYVLALGLSTLVAGLRSASMEAANIGLLLLTAFLAVRFFDTEWSFLARGIAFILIGAGLLATNALMLSWRKAGRE